MGGMGGFGPFGNIFSVNKNNEIKKGKPIIFNIKCSLTDLCLGKTKKIKITRKIIIDKDNKICEDTLKCCNNCSVCNGNGIINKIIQLGPGLMQQSRQPCNKCSGSGKSLKKEYSIKNKVELVEIFIEKGSCNGDKIKLTDKGNMIPGKLTSDLIIIINEIEHPEFKRKNNDLLLKMDISLYDALCGFNTVIKHPDNRELVIISDNIINNECIKCIETGGMPIKNDSFNNGKLFIVFNIIYPQNNELSENHKKILNDIFKTIPSYKRFINRKSKKDLLKDENTENIENTETDIEEHFLKNINPKEFGKKNNKYKSAEDSDSDDGENPQRCRTM